MSFQFKLRLAVILAFLGTCFGVATVNGAGESTKVYFSEGGDKITVASGGTIAVESGATFTNAGTTTNSGATSYTATQTFTLPNIYDVNTTISATAGGGQSGATLLSGEYNNITTVTSNFDSVRLPSLTVGGQQVTVRNSGASILAVFPFSGDAIDGLSANLSIDLAVGAEVTFTGINTTTWRVRQALDLHAPSTQKGNLVIQAADSAGNTQTIITNASQAAARTYTIPDFGASANFTLADAVNYKIDGVNMTPVKWVDVAVTAASLDSAGTALVLTGVSGDQYKIRDVRLVGGGTSFGAGGDRLIDLTDGTTVWTTIANADIESAPSATLTWGNAKVPFLTGTSNTKSASAANIRFQYSGGTTDHSGTGSITFSVCLEKTN